MRSCANSIERAYYAESAWEPCLPERFAALWTAAVATLPEAKGIAMITGLVLPVSKPLALTPDFHPSDARAWRSNWRGCADGAMGDRRSASVSRRR